MSITALFARWRRVNESNRPEETFDQFNTNVFGGLNVARAVLPYMRAQRSGTIVWVGSIGGWRATPNMGIYGASKFAVRGSYPCLIPKLVS